MTTTTAPAVELTLEQKLEAASNALTALEARCKQLSKDGIDGIEKDIAYLRSCAFTITRTALDAVKRDTKVNADEVESIFLDIQEVDDDLNNDELSAKLFAQGVVARKRSIDYAKRNKDNTATALEVAKYQRWASANPAAAADPLTNLPQLQAHGLIDAETYKTMMNEALKKAAANASATSAAL